MGAGGHGANRKDVLWGPCRPAASPGVGQASEAGVACGCLKPIERSRQSRFSVFFFLGFVFFFSLPAAADSFFSSSATSHT